MLEKVITGGQIGVDLVALFVAKDLGYQTGGMAPKGYRNDEGELLLLRDYFGLTESTSPSYRPRTIANVKAADQTVWFGDPRSPGGRLTIGTCRALGKPVLINPDAKSLRDILNTSYEVRVLNVAGNSQRTHPEACIIAQAVLLEALKRPIPLYPAPSDASFR